MPAMVEASSSQQKESMRKSSLLLPAPPQDSSSPSVRRKSVRLSAVVEVAIPLIDNHVEEEDHTESDEPATISLQRSFAFNNSVPCEHLEPLTRLLAEFLATSRPVVEDFDSDDEGFAESKPPGAVAVRWKKLLKSLTQFNHPENEHLQDVPMDEFLHRGGAAVLCEVRANSSKTTQKSVEARYNEDRLLTKAFRMLLEQCGHKAVAPLVAAGAPKVIIDRLVHAPLLRQSASIELAVLRHGLIALHLLVTPQVGHDSSDVPEPITIVLQASDGAATLVSLAERIQNGLARRDTQQQADLFNQYATADASTGEMVIQADAFLRLLRAFHLDIDGLRARSIHRMHMYMDQTANNASGSILSPSSESFCHGPSNDPVRSGLVLPEFTTILTILEDEVAGHLLADCLKILHVLTAASESTGTELLNTDLIQLLVSFATGNNREVVSEALGILMNLTAAEDGLGSKCNVFEKQGGILAMQRVIVQHPLDSDVCALAVQILGNLAHYSDLQAKVIAGDGSGNGIAVILGVLQRWNNASYETAAACAIALQNVVVNNPDAVPLFRGDSQVKTILDALRSHCHVGDTCLLLLEVLSELVEDDSIRDTILKNEGVAIMSRVCNSTMNVEVHRTSLELLCMLVRPAARLQAHFPTVLDEGGVASVLLSMTKFPSDDDVQIKGVHFIHEIAPVLCQVSELPPNCTIQLAAQAVFVAVLSAKEKRMLKTAMRTLKKMAAFHMLRWTFAANSQGLDALMHAMKGSPDDISLLEICAIGLEQCVSLSSPDVLSRLVDMEPVSLLMNACRLILEKGRSVGKCSPAVFDLVKVIGMVTACRPEADGVASVDILLLHEVLVLSSSSIANFKDVCLAIGQMTESVPTIAKMMATTASCEAFVSSFVAVVQDADSPLYDATLRTAIATVTSVVPVQPSHPLEASSVTCAMGYVLACQTVIGQMPDDIKCVVAQQPQLYRLIGAGAYTGNGGLTDPQRYMCVRALNVLSPFVAQEDLQFVKEVQEVSERAEVPTDPPAVVVSLATQPVTPSEDQAIQLSKEKMKNQTLSRQLQTMKAKVDEAVETEFVTTKIVNLLAAKILRYRHLKEGLERIAMMDAEERMAHQAVQTSAGSTTTESATQSAQLERLNAKLAQKEALHATERQDLQDQLKSCQEQLSRAKQERQELEREMQSSITGSQEKSEVLVTERQLLERQLETSQDQLAKHVQAEALHAIERQELIGQVTALKDEMVQMKSQFDLEQQAQQAQSSLNGALEKEVSVATVSAFDAATSAIAVVMDTKLSPWMIAQMQTSATQSKNLQEKAVETFLRFAMERLDDWGDRVADLYKDELDIVAVAVASHAASSIQMAIDTADQRRRASVEKAVTSVNSAAKEELSLLVGNLKAEVATLSAQLEAARDVEAGLRIELEAIGHPAANVLSLAAMKEDRERREAERHKQWVEYENERLLQDELELQRKGVMDQLRAKRAELEAEVVHEKIVAESKIADLRAKLEWEQQWHSRNIDMLSRQIQLQRMQSEHPPTQIPGLIHDSIPQPPLHSPSFSSSSLRSPPTSIRRNNSAVELLRVLTLPPGVHTTRAAPHSQPHPPPVKASGLELVSAAERAPVPPRLRQSDAPRRRRSVSSSAPCTPSAVGEPSSRPRSCTPTIVQAAPDAFLPPLLNHSSPVGHSAPASIPTPWQETHSLPTPPVNPSTHMSPRFVVRPGAATHPATVQS